MSGAVTAEVADEHGLTREEWAKIVALLGRPPTLEELGVFAVMWSEHCSYKSSRAFLRQLPTRAPRDPRGPGRQLARTRARSISAMGSPRCSRSRATTIPRS